MTEFINNPNRTASFFLGGKPAELIALLVNDALISGHNPRAGQSPSRGTSTGALAKTDLMTRRVIEKNQCRSHSLTPVQSAGANIISDKTKWRKVMQKGLIGKFLVILLVVGVLFAASPVRQAQAAVTVSTEAELIAALAGSDDTIELGGDFSLTSTIYVARPVTIDGKGFTITGPSGSNHGITVTASGVTIKDLTINGSGKTNLQFYRVTGGVVTDVTLSNAGNAGMIVNGSEVTISGVTTTNNAWGGINVDKGHLVIEDPLLIVNNVTTHTSPTGTLTPAIWVDTGNSAWVTVGNLYTVRTISGKLLFFDNAEFTAVYPVHNVTQGTDHNTIQAAIDAATAGDTIRVAAGTYAEDLEIGKSITLLGPNDSISPNGGTRVAEAVVKPVNETGTADPAVLITASNISVTLKGLTFDMANGTDNSDRFVELINKTSVTMDVQKNQFLNAPYCINGNWYITGTTNPFSLTLKDNYFSGSKVSNGISLWGNGGHTVDIQDNVWKDNGGWAVNFNFVTGTFTNNQILDTVDNGPAWSDEQAGFLFASYNDLTLTGNVFNGLPNPAIRIYPGFSGTLNATGNTFSNITDPDMGVIRITSDADLSGVSFEENKFLNNILDVQNLDTDLLDVTPNWWGSATGPAAGKIAGNANYIPWCADADCNTFGAPVVNTTLARYYSTIQAAIDDATADNTIEVSPGTYNEAITLNKPGLTLKSTAGAATTIINTPPGTLTNAVLVMANMGTVTIDGFTVTGFTQSGIVQPQAQTAGTTFIVKNNIITPAGNYLRNGIQVTGDGSQVIGNTINGARLTPNWSSAAIHVVNGSNITVQGNTTVPGAFGLDVGVAVTNYLTAPMANITITNNVIAADTPFKIDPYLGEIHNVQAHLNQATGFITGHAAYVYTDKPSSVDVTKNWWGSITGPGATNITGPADYLPYCLNPECTLFSLSLGMAPAANTTPICNIGTETTIAVKVGPFAKLSGYTIKVDFDRTKIQVLDVWNAGVLPGPGYEWEKDLGNSTGTLSYTWAKMGDGSGNNLVTDPVGGDLIFIKVKHLALGPTVLTLNPASEMTGSFDQILFPYIIDQATSTLTVCTMVAENFNWTSNNTGATTGYLAGISAGFNLVHANFTGATSLVVELLDASNNVLQRDTAVISMFTGLTQITAPFDMYGNFDYSADGYWTNERFGNYGTNPIPACVKATAVLAGGQTVTAQNCNLTSVRIVGTVKMQGRPGYSGDVPLSLNGLYQTQTVSINLPSQNYMFGPDGAGTFTFTTLQPRFLNVTAGLAKQFTAAGNMSLSDLTLRAGNAYWLVLDTGGVWDGTYDNTIGSADLSQIGTDWGKTGAALPALNQNSGDVNFDAKVNVQDMALACGNFGLTSATAYASWTP